MIRPRLAVVLLTIGVAGHPVQGASGATEEPTLAMQATSDTPHYSDPDRFRLVVTFHNHADTPILVLPARIRRHYRGSEDVEATYVPYPGPPISPWGGAFLLPPHQSRSVELQGMRDGDGIWRLDAGTYQLVTRYSVEPELESQRATASSLAPELRDIPVWVGKLEAEPIAVRYDPERGIPSTPQLP